MQILDARNWVIVRPLSIIVTRGIIVANDESTPRGTTHLSTAQARGLTPHHLSVMQAPPRVTNTFVGVVVIERLLRHPHSDGTGGREVAAAPCYILPVRPARVNEFAVASAPVGIVSRVSCHGLVPCHSADTHLGTGPIVGGQEVLRGVLGTARLEHG